MTANEVLNSIALKKRFCKDCNLPIAVFDNPYFAQRLFALNGITRDTISKFGLFCSELKKFNSEQDYFEYYNGIKDQIINDIKENPKFIRFSNEQWKDTYFCGKKNLYSEDNNGELFISLDMIKANFSALHHWSSDIFNGYPTWESFMQQYTDSSHIIHSKYIRQVIMGACDPKKQIKYEHHLMNNLANYIVPKLDKDLEIMSLGEDEILIRVSSNSEKTNNIDGLISDVAKLIRGSEIEHIIKISIFRLEKIKNTDGWIKRVYGGRDEFKCLNAEIYHQVLIHHFNQIITEDDLVFYHNGMLARFLKPIDNPFL